MIKKELVTFKKYITQKTIIYGYAVCTWEFVKKLVYVPASLEEMRVHYRAAISASMATGYTGSVVGNVISVCHGT